MAKLSRRQRFRCFDAETSTFADQVTDPGAHLGALVQVRPPPRSAFSPRLRGGRTSLDQYESRVRSLPMSCCLVRWRRWRWMSAGVLFFGDRIHGSICQRPLWPSEFRSWLRQTFQQQGHRCWAASAVAVTAEAELVSWTSFQMGDGAVEHTRIGRVCIWHMLDEGWPLPYVASPNGALAAWAVKTTSHFLLRVRQPTIAGGCSRCAEHRSLFRLVAFLHLMILLLLTGSFVCFYESLLFCWLKSIWIEVFSTQIFCPKLSNGCDMAVGGWSTCPKL